MCGFCGVWVGVCVGFGVGGCMCGFSNVWVCVGVGFVMCGCGFVWVLYCVGLGLCRFLMCGRVYV
jgi:hypothetical protein